MVVYINHYVHLIPDIKKSIQKKFLLIIRSEAVSSPDHTILCGRRQLGGHSRGGWSAAAGKTAGWAWAERTGAAPRRDLLLATVCVGVRWREARGWFFAGFVGDQQAGRIRDSVFTWTNYKYVNCFSFHTPCIQPRNFHRTLFCARASPSPTAIKQ